MAAGSTDSTGSRNGAGTDGTTQARARTARPGGGDSADRAAAVLGTAARLAAEVLAPAAMSVEASQRVPAAHLDRLAAEGFYGMAGPRDAGGLDLAFTDACRVVEVLASGCLSTAFVWLQHHGAVRAVAAAPGPLRAELLGPLCRGERRAGVALGGLLPGPPRLRARAVPGGYLLDGTSPWVTGWGLADTLYVAARDEHDTVIWAVLDVPGEGTISAEPLPLVAVMASATVELSFQGHPVPAGRVTGTLPYRDWPRQDAAGLRLNGSLALGLIARCCGPARGAASWPVPDRWTASCPRAGPRWMRPARRRCRPRGPPRANWPSGPPPRSWSQWAARPS